MSEPVLTVTGARRRYRREREALRGVDLELRSGQVTALLGPSGSGKSTLLRAIAGLETLDAGEIYAAGAAWSAPGLHLPPEKRRVGMVFQDYALFPHLSALDNVAFGLKGEDRKDRALAALEAAELGDRARAFPHELSGGEQQRVALARALAPQPDVVLLDEPFSGLDLRLRGELREQSLAALKAAGAAALLVTHDPEEAMASADELALMCDGLIIQTGRPADVYLRPDSAIAARLLGDVNVWAGAVSKGVLDTPLGALKTDLADGARAEALIRPEAIVLSADPKGSGEVLSIRTIGADVELRLRTPDGRVWQARQRGPLTFRQGDRVKLWLDESYAVVVAAAG